MIGLDTNVLVRYLTQDDQTQATRANSLIEENTRAALSIYINNIVLCELSWVMMIAYKISKEELINLLEKILLTAQFEIENREFVWQALSDYKISKADFADALIERINLGAGCEKTYTFDSDCTALSTFVTL